MSTFMNVQEAAELFGITVRHFHRLYIETGRIKPVEFATVFGAGKKHLLVRAAVKDLYDSSAFSGKKVS